ncbi:MAG: hypothetical protein V3W06_01410, partial [Acidimicrobiia bacterium]
DLHAEVLGISPALCAERAVLVTRYFREHADRGRPMVLQKAGALAHVLRNKRVRIYAQELLVGCKAILKFNERASFAAGVDFSGFGIGSGSRLTWNLELIMRYMMTESTMLAVGYRLLDIDVAYGSGATRNNLDAQFSGPVVGVGFVF